MRVTIKKPVRVNCLSGEVEVTELEYSRLVLLDAVEAEKPVFEKEVKETPEKEKRTTRKAK